MSFDWRNWCRLCGDYEATLKIEYTADIVQLIRHFLNFDSHHDIKICSECLRFLNEINNFSIKTRAIEAMFVELFSLSENEFHGQSLNDLRIRYGLKELTTELNETNTIDNTQNFFTEVLEPPVKEELEDDCNIIKADNNLEATTFNQTILECELENKIRNTKEENSEDGSEEETSDEEYKFEKKKRAVFKKRKTTLSEDRAEYEKSEEEKLFDFICHLCHLEFPKMCFLSKHCRTEHNCLPQVNCVCGKTLGTWNRLLIHKRKHFPEKSHYECKECGLTYLKRSTYDAHIMNKHGPAAEKFVCTQWKKHERTHLPDELKLTELCTICNKRFVNKNSLQSHISSVHTKENIFTCEQCGKCFTSKGNLRSHLTSHIKEKTVPCDLCDLKFKCVASLRSHKRNHSEKIYACEICSNKFRSRNTLRVHMLVHSDEKKYKCTYCSNEYKRPMALKCHLSVHTGERPYACTFCDRTFVNGSNCRKHKLKDHPLELQEWERLHGKGKTQK